jgi:hypothetical protein
LAARCMTWIHRPASSGRLQSQPVATISRAMPMAL